MDDGIKRRSSSEYLSAPLTLAALYLAGVLGSVRSRHCIVVYGCERSMRSAMVRDYSDQGQ
jgi:hypothetical protein